MEWQTGKENGYIRWYHGEDLIFEVTADTLKSKPGGTDTLTQIPYEAMYFILNTDISPRWGWNGCDPDDPCMQANPGLCSNEGELMCQDCQNPDCLVCPHATSWLADFCNDIHGDNPAEFKIDYIRVYQDINDNTHSLGCDPADFPTKEYIEENWERYTYDSFLNDQPLLKVQHGGGPCTDSSNCGIDVSTGLYNGFCRDGVCDCSSEWTGPNCISPCEGEYSECTSERADPLGSGAPKLQGILVGIMWCLIILTREVYWMAGY